MRQVGGKRLGVVFSIFAAIVASLPIGIVFYLADIGLISFWWVLGVVMLYVVCTIVFVYLLDGGSDSSK